MRSIEGGPWNIMNGVTGILWFWILAYDLWNFAYTYNCLGDHSFYCGLVLLLSCTIPAFFVRKEAWLQHRAQTLAVWVMFAMTVPSFIDESMFAVKSSNDPRALFAVSALALAANLAVFGYQLYVMVRKRKHPLKEEIYSHLPAYREIAAERSA